MSHTVAHLVRYVVVAVILVLTPGCSVFGDDTMEITALMSDSSGLFVGNEVGILGVTVGKVTAIEPAGDHVVVTMEIEAGRDVPADAGAVVVARSVATDRYVELTPVYHEGAKMADGDVIALDRTRTPVDFDEVLATLNTFATGIAGSRETRLAIKNFVDTGAEALNGKGKLINKSITSLSGAVAGVAGQREDIVASVKSLDVLVGAMARNEKTTGQFISQVSRASGLLAAERGNFRAALRSLDKAVTVVAGFALKHRADIVKTLDNSAAVMRQVMSKRRQLAEILEVMPLALENIKRTVHNGRLAVRINPLILAPLTAQLTQICEALPLDLCDNLGSEPPLLGDLLGRGQP